MILPQLCLHLSEEENKDVPNVSGDYLVTAKLNGTYAYIDYDTDLGWGYIQSKQGRTIPYLYWAKKLFIDLPIPNKNIRLIMEVTIDSAELLKVCGSKTVFIDSSIDEQAYSAIFNLYDILLVDSYWIDQPENYALNRWNLLQTLDVSKCENKIRKIPLLTISNKKEIWMRYFKEVVEAGGEEIVLKKANCLYSPGERNSALMKIKLAEIC